MGQSQSIKRKNVTVSLMMIFTAITIMNYKPCHALFQQSFLIKTKSSFPSSIISLKGGYDATIGPDPSNPIQFFTLPNNTCPYAARTLIVLNELHFPYDKVEVQVQPKPDWYLKINPKGKVPAIRVPYDNNEIVYESAICDEYLCDLYDHTRSRIQSKSTTSTTTTTTTTTTTDTKTTTTLMPKDPIQKAKMRLLNDKCDTMLNTVFYTFLMNKDESKEEEMKHKLDEILKEYEDTLQSSGGPYLLGEHFTLADVHVLPFFLRLIVSAKTFKNYVVTKEKYPLLVSWFELCSERESVKIASLTEEQIVETYKKFINMDYSFGGLNKNK